jgi:hypothetical protein
MTSPYLTRPTRSEAEARVDLELSRLRALNAEMLEALESIVNYEASPDFSKWKAIISRVVAAIRKAEGKE